MIILTILYYLLFLATYCNTLNNFEDDSIFFNKLEFTENVAPDISNVLPFSSCSLYVNWTLDNNNPNLTNLIVNWKEEQDVNNQTLISQEVDKGESEYFISSLKASTAYIVWIESVYYQNKCESNAESGSTNPGDPPNIVDLESYDIEDSRFSLRWKEFSDGDGCPVAKYIVSWNTVVLWNPDRTEEGEVSTTVPRTTLTNLIPYSSYTISVYSVATDNLKGNYSGQETVETLEGIPGPPESVDAISFNSSAVILNWEEPLEKNGIILTYIVRWGLELGEISEEILNATETSTKIEELDACGDYFFLIDAETKGGIGNPAVSRARTLPEVPPPVTDLHIDDKGSRSVDLIWELPDTHCSVLEYNLTANGFILWNPDSDENFETTFEGGNTSYVVNDLIPWTNYTLCLMPMTEGGYGEEQCVNLTTLEDAPSAPVNLNSFVQSPYEVMLQWSPPEEENGVLLYYNISWYQDEILIDFDNTDETEYNITGLSACLKYEFTVSSSTEAGEGELATITDQLNPEKPPPPNFIKCEALSSSEVELSWQPSKTTCPITEYRIRAAGIILWNGNTTEVFLEIIGNSHESVFDQLFAYTNYTFTIDAVNEGGYSKTSSCQATTYEDVPSPPDTMYIPEDEITKKSLKVKWTKPTILNGRLKGFNVSWIPNDGYRYVNYSDDPNKTYSFVIDNLEKDTRYTVNISADTYAGFGEAATRSAYTKNNAAGIAFAIIIPIIVIAILVGLGYVYRDNLRSQVDKIRKTEAASEYEEINEFSIAPIPFHQLKTHVNKLQTGNALSAEFEALNALSHRGTTTEAESRENEAKNRYTNILPFDETRVILQNDGSNYINASHIASFREPNFFIAAQGPKDNTMEDFWNMIWTEKVDVIVMLTACTENGKDKCSKYWPQSSGFGSDLGNFTIQNISEEITPLFTARMIDIKMKTDQRKRLVRFYQFTAWPDFGVPAKEEELLRLLTVVKQNLNMNRNRNKVLVHCSAGVGRSGTFIALWNIIEEIDSGIHTVSVRKEVLNLRRQRMLMVQSKEQYLYLHKCVLAYYENQDKWRVRVQAQLDSETSYQASEPTENSSVSTFDNLGFEPVHDFKGNLI